MEAYWASPPLEPTCRLPARRPVPNYYSCLQTLISWDGLQNQLHTRWANSDCSSAQEWTWIYSWQKEPIRTRAARLLSASPESRHLWRHSLKIFIIALPFQAAATCVMIASVALQKPPTDPPQHHPPISHLLRMRPSKVREGAAYARPLGCVERRLAAARFTPVLHSQRASIHHPPWGKQLAHS